VVRSARGSVTRGKCAERFRRNSRELAQDLEVVFTAVPDFVGGYVESVAYRGSVGVDPYPLTRRFWTLADYSDRARRLESERHIPKDYPSLPPGYLEVGAGGTGTGLVTGITAVPSSGGRHVESGGYGRAVGVDPYPFSGRFWAQADHRDRARPLESERRSPAGYSSLPPGYIGVGAGGTGTIQAPNR
jgi:hypothetical protein